MSLTARLALTAAFAGLLAVGVLASADGAKADPYRWCAQYGTSDDNGTNCYFLTLQQCQAAISGNGGFCTPNQFYNGAPVTTGDDTTRRSRQRSR